MKSGSLNLLEPSGPVQACSGIAIPLLGTLLLIQSTTSSSAQVSVFDGDRGWKIYLRCCSMDGLDEEIVVSVQWVPSQVNLLVEMLRRDGEFIRTSQHSNMNSQWPRKSIREHIMVQRETRCPPFYLGDERDISLLERGGGLQGISDYEVRHPRCVFPKYKV